MYHVTQRSNKTNSSLSCSLNLTKSHKVSLSLATCCVGQLLLGGHQPENTVILHWATNIVYILNNVVTQCLHSHKTYTECGSEYRV